MGVTIMEDLPVMFYNSKIKKLLREFCSVLITFFKKVHLRIYINLSKKDPTNSQFGFSIHSFNVKFD